mmetsp:Transcript_92919/g.182087  ORF Transcript_92919/g.182087 Transcript_92919/m.182087 type:complete len:458 (-) Transcript_92919:15-1388(-)
MPCGDAPEDEDVFDGQILGVLRDAVTEVHADGLVDLADLRLLGRILHGGLDLLQALRMRDVARRIHVRVLRHHLRRQVDAALLREPRGRALAKVHRGVAGVRRPRIAGGIGVQVERVVSVLVDPAGQGVVLIHIAGTLAAAEGDAKEVAFADHLTARDGRHLAVIDDLDWDATELVLRDVVEDRHDPLLVDVRRDVREAVAPRGLAVGRHGAGGAAADGLDLSGELGRGVLHRLHDHVVVVLGIRVRDVPLRLRGVKHLPVLHRDRLDIALAEVESDAAAAGDLAAVDALVLRRRQLLDAVDGGHRPRGAEDLWHCRHLELVLALQGISLRDRRADLLRPAHGELEAAALPKHVADRLASEENRGVEALVVRGEDRQRVAAAAAARAAHGEVEVGDFSELPAVGDLPQVLALAQDEGAEVRVQGRRHTGAHEQVLHRRVGHHGVGDLAHGSRRDLRR